MPSLLTSTQQVLGGATLPNCDSRSLRLTRYARPDLRDDIRKEYLQRAVDSERHDEAPAAYHAWLATLPAAIRIHARLEARLLINMAGSVLENAGLNLDRYGTAYIPGSAVKACARRTALATLRQWCESGVKPSAAQQDALAPAATSFTSPGDLLLAIVHVFGCTDLEWHDYDYKKNKGSDLAWACTDQWIVLSDAARATLNKVAGVRGEATPCRRGTVAFLPAYPTKRPTADLELDVLTGHHPAYYGGMRPTAIDDENPIPVFFPAVAAKAVYAFPLLPVGPPNLDALVNARTWLATGLAVLGVGAKTAAGYGYFHSDDYNAMFAEARASAEAAEKALEATRLASLVSDESVLRILRGTKEDALRGKIKPYSFEPKFWPQTDTEQTWLTLLRYLTQENPALWNKEKANEKSAITKAIKSLADKTRFPLP